MTITLSDDEHAALTELAHITEWPMREMIVTLLMIEVKNQFDALDIDTPLMLLDMPVAGNA
jgi:hypothetical protein